MEWYEFVNVLAHALNAPENLYVDSVVLDTHASFPEDIELGLRCLRALIGMPLRPPPPVSLFFFEYDWHNIILEAHTS